LIIIEDKNRKKNKNIIEIDSKDKELIMLNSYLKHKLTDKYNTNNTNPSGIIN
jgi:hypothetical protein